MLGGVGVERWLCAVCECCVNVCAVCARSSTDDGSGDVDVSAHKMGLTINQSTKCTVVLSLSMVVFEEKCA